MLQGRIRAYLSLACVEAIATGGLLNGRVVAAASQSCARAPGGEPTWRQPVHALGELLAQAPWRGRIANIALSSDFVRLALLPKGEPGMREDELRALGSTLITRVHGTPPGGWRVRLDRVDRSNIAVAAIEEALHGAIAEAVKGAGCRLGALRPVASAFGRKGSVRKGTLWVALAEQGASAVGLRERGEWRALRVRPQGAEGWPEILSGIEREAARLACPAREVLLVSERAPSPCEGWSVLHRTPAQLSGLKASQGAGGFACLA